MKANQWYFSVILFITLYIIEIHAIARLFHEVLSTFKLRLKSQIYYANKVYFLITRVERLSPSKQEKNRDKCKRKPPSTNQFVYTRINLIVNNLPLNLLQSRENVDFGLLTCTQCIRENAGEIIKESFISQFPLVLRQYNELITLRQDDTWFVAEPSKWKLLVATKFGNRPCEGQALNAFWRTLS